MSRVGRILTALALVLVALPALTAAGNGTSDAARAEHQRIIDFWTPERVAQAVPREVIFDVAQGRFRLATPTHHRPDHSGGGPPGGGGDDGGGGDTAVTGASWEGGGEIVDAEGKVLFALGSTYYVCSATLVKDSRTNESVVLTAGHCVYDNETNQFATNWMFIPNYDGAPAALDTAGDFCDSTAHGCWTAKHLVVHSGFANEPGFTANAILHDFAFAVLGDGGKSGTALAEDLVAVDQDIQFSEVSRNTFVHAFGYPHAPPYDGSDLVYCAGNVNFDNRLFRATYKLSCGMTGGSSGGGWFASFDEATGVGTLTSVNSYKYSNDPGSMYGPKFNSDTQDAYNTANSTGSDAIVP
ncbi:MAG TPA: hypothetical protein VK960_10980 [Acidimicrobiia bacterium]|nr:hypothetical protein [Acidimicrobiia bacterium]